MKFKLLLGISLLGWVASLVIYILSYFNIPGLMTFCFLLHGGVMFVCGYLILLMCMTNRPLQTNGIWDFLRYIRAMKHPYGVILPVGFSVLLCNAGIVLFFDCISKHAITGSQQAEIESARFFSSGWMLAYWLACIGWMDRMEKDQASKGV